MCVNAAWVLFRVTDMQLLGRILNRLTDMQIWQLFNGSTYNLGLDRDYQYIDLMEGFRTEKEHKQSFSLFHDNIDSWPLTKTKIATINDLISDYELDMFDEGHTNISGMKKLTSYVGEYSLEMEVVEDHRMDSDYQV